MKIANRTCRIDIISFSIVAALSVLVGCDGPAPQPEKSHDAASPSAKSPSPKAAAAADQSARPKSPSPEAGAAADQSARPVTDDEARKFVTSLEASLKAGDREAVNADFDYEAFVNRAMFGIKADRRTYEIAAHDIREAYTGTKGIGLDLAGKVAEGERCRLLRLHRQGNEQRALFRIANGDDVEYWDFVILCDTNGQPKIGDYFSYLDGYLFSEMVHEDALCDVVRMDRQLISTLSPAEREYSNSHFEFQKMREHVHSNQFKEALDVYKKFPAAMQNNPYVLHECLVARCGAGGECDDTIRAYQAARPNEPGVDLHLFSHYFILHRFDDALASIERLDKAVGGDPRLDANRAMVFVMKGDLVAAKKCAQSAAAAEPDDPFTRKVLQTVVTAERGGAAKRSR
jgi:hypothetical protein